MSKEAIANLSTDEAARLLKGWIEGLRGRQPTMEQRITMNDLEDRAEGFKPYDPKNAGDTDEDL